MCQFLVELARKRREFSCELGEVSGQREVRIALVAFAQGLLCCSGAITRVSRSERIILGSKTHISLLTHSCCCCYS